ncbi:MAG: hypothetical protein V7642_5340 [Burkholderiales bacterium]|jgi:hypothetical protein
MHGIKQIMISIAVASLPFVVAAQGPIAYPAKGQSSATQSKDEGQCYAWAKKSTGIDPATVAAAPPPQESGSTAGGGERARGAARGAVGGAAIGAIAGDAGKGAGVGAVAGTMAGGRQARQNQAARNQQAQGQQTQAIDTYNRAYGACMSGRGYTIG